MPIRILVVDDSALVRKMVTSALSDVRGMEVVATAATGRIALARLAECKPDVVILDVEMPDMDGIETLKQIRKLTQRLPVIMFSAKTERAAVATIDALTYGASDYVTKPTNAGNMLLAMARVRDELVPKIQALTSGSRPPAKPQSSPLATVSGTTTGRIATLGRQTSVINLKTTPIPTTTQGLPRARTTASPVVPLDGPIRLSPVAGPRPPVEIVAIGASTGGPNALAVLLPQLPADFPVPIVIVQHMLATFTRHFASRLATQCRIKIVEASAGDALLPGHAYVARGDYHLLTERRLGRANIAMNQEVAENFCRPAVDVLFRSVAHAYGPAVLGVVLTGMGHDGLLGCTAIREAGGDVIVQDEQSSVVWGMPGFVARAGLASQVLALDQLVAELRRRVAPSAPRSAGVVP